MKPKVSINLGPGLIVRALPTKIDEKAPIGVFHPSHARHARG